VQRDLRATTATRQAAHRSDSTPTAMLSSMSTIGRSEVKRCAWCGNQFASRGDGHIYCDRTCQVRAHRQKARTPEPTPTHLFIPDTQVKPGVPTVHLSWIGQYIVDRFAGRPFDLTIVHAGDHYDLPSLSVLR
jgi:hypothetical protein